MIKLIASDIDGTILQHGETSISSDLINVIEQLYDKGIHFIAASGRPYANLKMLFKDVKCPISYISENGGMNVYNEQTHIPFYHNRQTVECLVNALRDDSDCELFYSCEHTIYIESSNQEFISRLKQNVGYSITVVEDLLALDILPMKLAICNSKGIVNSEQKYKKLLSDKVHVITSGNDWLDFMPFGANKGVALKEIADALSISPDECMAFGDQYNDVEMLQFAGTSFAMENAAKGISKHSTHTTDSVIKELKKLLETL